MGTNQNAKKIILGLVVLALLWGAGFWTLKTKQPESVMSNNGGAPSAGPAVSLKTEASEVGTLTREEMEMSSSAPMVVGTGSAEKEMARLSAAKTEFVEDYIRGLANEWSGAIAKIDEKKLMSLPGRDLLQLEMAFDFANSKSHELMVAIAKVLVNRETYGTVFREDSFEGALKRAYLSKTEVDYAKLKELKIENPGNLGFITGEMFFSPQSGMLNEKLLEALDYRIGLLPRNSRTDSTYSFIYLVRTFVADVVSQEYLTPARAMREMTVTGAPNFFALQKETDLALAHDAEAILTKYRTTNSLKEVKAVPSFSEDLKNLEAIYQKMLVNPAFKERFRGLPPAGYVLVSMYAIDGRPEKALETMNQIGELAFNGLDGVKIAQKDAIAHKFRLAMVYEVLGDKFYQTDKTKAVDAYQKSIDNMREWLYARPHYPLPRAFVKRVEKKLELSQ